MDVAEYRGSFHDLYGFRSGDNGVRITGCISRVNVRRRIDFSNAILCEQDVLRIECTHNINISTNDLTRSSES
jgi:hypothetical protein